MDIDIIDTISARASRQYSETEGDYRNEDGLLICGKCNTQKECVLTKRDGTTRTVRCACECSVAQNAKEAEEKRKRDRLQYLDSMRRTGFPDAEMREWTFAKSDHADQRNENIARRYVANFDAMRKQGTGLLLCGSVGTGKSFLAAAIANELISQGTPCLMTNFSRIISRISEKFGGDQKYLDDLNRFDLLIIDDLGAERDTEFTWEKVMNVIDARYRAGLPLIITTNLGPKDFTDRGDIRRQRVFSRLKEMCVCLEVKGMDRRGKKMQDKLQTAKSLLGL
ncbi:MAG: AFG1-like ATPase [Namikivirus ikeda]|uniref:AFG1-like ATPase n=1 Tax=Bacteriophage sp. TaxID=38018 RepID=A0ABY5TVB3_9VIRU|nr:MAG: AFG1-like ATPase [Bacteriophage sp.]